jgi:hypothetical protein
VFSSRHFQPLEAVGAGELIAVGGWRTAERREIVKEHNAKRTAKTEEPNILRFRII